MKKGKIIWAVLIIVLVIFLALLYHGSHMGMTGKVVDAETGKPIEEAVVVVGWSTRRGLPGMNYGKAAKIAEVVANENGRVKLPGILTIDPFVEQPYVTVYKEGYVAWNSRWIFPSWEKREDFKWRDGYIFKLEKFRSEYSHDKHESFISSVTRGNYGVKFRKSIRWEELKAFEERQVRDRGENAK